MTHTDPYSVSVPQIVNSHLMRDLSERGLWNDDMKQRLIKDNGSVQVHLKFCNTTKQHMQHFTHTCNLSLHDTLANWSSNSLSLEYS